MFTIKHVSKKRWLWLGLVPLMVSCAAPRIKQARFPLEPEYSFQKRGAFLMVYYSGPDSLTTQQTRPLRYRTVAVDPRRILPGSVLFIPEAYGVLLPTGEIHDGFFLAQDVRPFVRSDTLAVFIGAEGHRRNAFARAGLKPGQPITVYSVYEPYDSAVKARFAHRYTIERRKPLFRMLAKEIDQFIRETNQKIRDIRTRLMVYSERGKGTPYLIFLLGEGPEAKYDQDPLMDFARVDCMTFVEQCLAMAISNSYAEMFRRLQRIRYRDGVISYKTRNHYTIADWLPNNRWLLKDATTNIGGPWTRPMTKVIDRRAFFQASGLPEDELTDVPGPDTLTVSYIPAEHLLKIKDRLQGGEIVSIVSSQPGIFSAHMGLIVRDRYGNVIFRHGSSARRNRKVVDERLEDVVASLLNSKNRVGMMFMRVRPEWRWPDSRTNGHSPERNASECEN
ncbi:MAG: DUF1460 domain-containing protein [candidate division KSB1 bacterium]|nr:DUF1460 domain-containing protein [candidate division KSB1 bacterium]